MSIHISCRSAESGEGETCSNNQDIRGEYRSLLPFSLTNPKRGGDSVVLHRKIKSPFVLGYREEIWR